MQFFDFLIKINDNKKITIGLYNKNEFLENNKRIIQYLSLLGLHRKDIISGTVIITLIKYSCNSNNQNDRINTTLNIIKKFKELKYLLNIIKRNLYRLNINHLNLATIRNVLNHFY